MLLAWSDPQLEGCCTSAARLRVAARGQVEAAEDLLSLVAQAPRLGDLAQFRSVQMEIRAGKLALSIQEVDMHVRPLNQAGVPRIIAGGASARDYSTAEALLVQDLHVRGRSVLRRAS